MADQEVIKHTKAVYKIWKNPHSGWKHKLQEIGIEIFIIVFAVSLSIWLHNLSEKNHDSHEAHEFLEGLKTDLQKDAAEMKNDLSSYLRVEKGIAYFQPFATNKAKLDADSTKKYSFLFFNSTFFNSNNSRFEGLKASGKLSIIKNQHLLNTILDFYEEQIPYLNMLNANYNDYKRDRLGAFIDEHVRYDSVGGANWEDLIGMPQLQNGLRRLEGVREVSDQYEKSIALAESIIAEIEKELE